jgi:hypothetical protein
MIRGGLAFVLPIALNDNVASSPTRSAAVRMIQGTPMKLLTALTVLFFSLSVSLLLADDKPAEPKPADAKAEKDKKDSAEEIEKKLKEKIDAATKANENPQPAPGTNKTDTPKPEGPKLPAPTPGRIDQPDPKIIGTAPGSAAPKLKREGEFILSRRGRLIRSEGGSPMFAFDADSDKAAEAPMILLPCRLLQSMEELAADHGDRTVFLVSGQVFVYKGANYMLPTMMKPAIDKGNLQK